jgi:hypothetical protein
MVHSSTSGPAEEGVQHNCFNFLFHYTPAATTSIQYSERKTERRQTSYSNSVTHAPAVYSQAEKNQRPEPTLSVTVKTGAADPRTCGAKQSAVLTDTGEEAVFIPERRQYLQKW